MKFDFRPRIFLDSRLYVVSCLCWLFLCPTPFPLYSSTNHLKRSLELLQKGDLVAAEEEARLAMSDPSTLPVGYAALGAIRLQQKRFEEGSEFLRKAIELHPRLLEAHLNLAHAYLSQGKTDQAYEVYRNGRQSVRRRRRPSIGRRE